MTNNLYTAVVFNPSATMLAILTGIIAVILVGRASVELMICLRKRYKQQQTKERQYRGVKTEEDDDDSSAEDSDFWPEDDDLDKEN